LPITIGQDSGCKLRSTAFEDLETLLPENNYQLFLAFPESKIVVSPFCSFIFSKDIAVKKTVSYFLLVSCQFIYLDHQLNMLGVYLNPVGFG